MADYLFGSTSTGTNSGNGSYLYSTRFQCSSDSTVSEIQIYSGSAGAAKVALYSDNAGSPDSLIVANETGTAISASQWNVISIADTSVTNGTYYWIAAVVLGYDDIRFTTTGGTSKYLSGQTYSTFTFPSTYPASSGAAYEYTLAAFGSTSVSYESDLGTGTATAIGGSVSASTTRVASLGLGSAEASGSNIETTLTVAADADLGTGTATATGGAISHTNGYVSELGTGVAVASANGIRSLEHYESELATGTATASGGGITQLFSYESELGTGTAEASGGPLITVDQSGATFQQSRLASSPFERMKGCVFGENFVSGYRVRKGGGSVVGGVSFTSSAVLDGYSYITYSSLPLTDTFSAVIRFSANAASSGLLFGTQDPISASLTGWRIDVDSTGIRANHSDGTVLGTSCSVDIDYHDDNIHTVTYVVDLISGDHTLYVDSESDTKSTSASGTIGASKTIQVGGLGFIGTIKNARLFESLFTSDEHSVYHADSIASILGNALSVYRCDERSDRDDHVWSQNLTMYDLTKGDGVSAGYPTQVNGHYEFDGVDDYVSGWPTQATEHTDSAVLQTTGYPYVQQVNDSTIKDDLTVSGSFGGKLYNLVLHDSELTDLEKKHLEYLQLYNTSRGHADRIDNQLIVEGTAVLSHFYEDTSLYLTDYSKTDASSSGTDLYWNNGLKFSDSTSMLTVQDEAGLRLDKITIAVSGIGLDDISSTEYLVYKNLNYDLSLADVDASYFEMDFTGSSIEADRGDVTHLAVSAIDGYKPRFFVNGSFVSEGDIAVSLNDSTTNDLIIGNDAGGNPFSGTIKRVHVFNSALTDTEIMHLYNQSTVDISSTHNEAFFYSNSATTVSLTIRGPSTSGMWVDWGDGTDSEWIQYAGTGTNVNFNHTFSTSDEKKIKFSGLLSDATLLYARVNGTFYGDVGNLSSMTGLNTLHVYNTNIGGDLSGLSFMTNADVISLSNSSISGDLSGISALTSLTEFYGRNLSLTGPLSDLSSLPDLEQLLLDGTDVGVTTDSLPAWSGINMRLDSCGLTSTEVDNCLIQLDNAGGTSGTINIAGSNAVRTSSSDAAKTSLLGKSWTITVNE
jgi:hypothetical protein